MSGNPVFETFNHPNDDPVLTHWGWVTHICVSKLIIIGTYNGLLPGRCQAIIWTNAGILLIRPLGTNFIEILTEINIFSFKKMHLKMSSAKCRPFCLDFNVLMCRHCNHCDWRYDNPAPGGPLADTWLTTKVDMKFLEFAWFLMFSICFHDQTTSLRWVSTRKT